MFADRTETLDFVLTSKLKTRKKDCKRRKLSQFALPARFSWFARTFFTVSTLRTLFTVCTCVLHSFAVLALKTTKLGIKQTTMGMTTTTPQTNDLIG